MPPRWRISFKPFKYQSRRCNGASYLGRITALQLQYYPISVGVASECPLYLLCHGPIRGISLALQKQARPRLGKPERFLLHIAAHYRFYGLLDIRQQHAVLLLQKRVNRAGEISVGPFGREGKIVPGTFPRQKDVIAQAQTH